MIIEWLLDMLEAGWTFVTGFFPLTSFNPVDSFSGALQHLGDLNYFIPITELAAAVLAAVIIFPAFAGVTLFLWLVAFIRGGSSRG